MFTADYKPEPFWWERSPRPDTGESLLRPDTGESLLRPDTGDPLPSTSDVAIIGSGYTGLNAAIVTARGGRHTVVLDAEAAGFGCSSRNGGQVSTSLKPDYPELARKFGPIQAQAILREGHDALAWIGQFISDEQIDCDFKVCGRFNGAHSPGQYETLARSLEDVPDGLETDSYMVPRNEQHAEIDTDLYNGGMVSPRHASLDPGRYHQGLLTRALDAGAEVKSHCEVLAVSGTRGRFTLNTSRGVITAKEVIVATNGYTGSLTPWNQRRVIPIGSYIIATEPLDPQTIQRLIPRDRVISDTRRLVVYYRTCPERRRIIFGARVSIAETNPTAAVPALRQGLSQLFPELSSVRVSHAWMGFVAYTFNHMPHLGTHDGVHYAMGYCGSGVSLATYFGRKIGQQVLGSAEGHSPLCDVPAQSRPYYFGQPWFLAPSIAYYRWMDNHPRR